MRTAGQLPGSVTGRTRFHRRYPPAYLWINSGMEPVELAQTPTDPTDQSAKRVHVCPNSARHW